MTGGNAIYLAADTIQFPGDAFLQYGAIGALCAILIAYTRVSIIREQKRSDTLEAKNDALNISIQEKMIPSLIAATNSIQQANSLLTTMQARFEIQAQSNQQVETTIMVQKLLKELQVNMDGADSKRMIHNE
jgi:hypothetical protein